MSSFERYTRQMILPGFGAAAQQRLQDAKVLVVGAGGLGCPALQYLAGAGVGNIGIIDGDRVSLSNLHRQVLFSEKDIGANKATVAAERLRQLNKDILIHAMPYAITHANACNLIEQYDMVLDGTDNFTARYTINDACVLVDRPFVYGAVSRYEGQLSFFNHPKAVKRFTYRDLFPVAPAAHEIPSCEEAGVIGVLPGIIGNLQAAEVIKYITGLGETLHGRLLTFDLLHGNFYEMELRKQDVVPKIDRESFEQMEDAAYCDTDEDIPEISIAKFKELKKAGNIFVLDVRERHEYPAIDFADAQIPMSELQYAMDGLPDREIYIICHQGIRSVYAGQLIRARRGLTVYSVKGGLTAYFNQQA